MHSTPNWRKFCGGNIRAGWTGSGWNRRTYSAEHLGFSLTLLSAIRTASQRPGLSSSDTEGLSAQGAGWKFTPVGWTPHGFGFNLEGGTTRGGKSVA